MMRQLYKYIAIYTNTTPGSQRERCREGSSISPNTARQASLPAFSDSSRRPAGLANWRGSIKLDPSGLGPSQNCVSTITKMRVVANEPAARRGWLRPTAAQQEMANKIYHLSDMIRKAKPR